MSRAGVDDASVIMKQHPTLLGAKARSDFVKGRVEGVKVAVEFVDGKVAGEHAAGNAKCLNGLQDKGPMLSTSSSSRLFPDPRFSSPHWRRRQLLHTAPPKANAFLSNT